MELEEYKRASGCYVSLLPLRFFGSSIRTPENSCQAPLGCFLMQGAVAGGCDLRLILVSLPSPVPIH